MILGLTCALGVPVATGVASVLQSVGARRSEETGIGAKLALSLARQLPYVGGMALDVAGFVLTIVALRSLPLFVVSALGSTAVAVTAISAAVYLRVRPSRSERTGIAVVVAGVVLLALSAAPESGDRVDIGVRAGLLIGIALAGGLAALIARPGRLRPGLAAVLLSALAGCGFASVSIAARSIGWPHPWWHGFGDLLLWDIAAGGLLGTVLFGASLQRGRVVTATAALFATETVAPAMVGIFVLHDHAKAGYGWVAFAGFLVTIAGALSLARYGELPAHVSTAATEADDAARTPEQAVT